MQLEGPCECGAIRFTVSSEAPNPYRICYCRRCRKIAGETGAAINILADVAKLKVMGETSPTSYAKPNGPITSFCPRCGSAPFVEL